MATMVKEKRREKKKSKEKPQNSISKVLETNEPLRFSEEVFPLSVSEDIGEAPGLDSESQTKLPLDNSVEKNDIESKRCLSDSTQFVPKLQLEKETHELISKNTMVELMEQTSYLQCNVSLEKLILTDAISLGSEANETILDNVLNAQIIEGDIIPSAPVFEEQSPQITYQNETSVVTEVIRLKSMPLDEAMRLFEGAEIAQVIAMSEIEEVIVNSGPMCGPDHPLVDLLSTFRRSLIAVERERTHLTIGFAEEKKFRSTLWKIDKRIINDTLKCRCGLDVSFKVKYDHAELQKDKLPIGQMKLEALLRDVQESYCHHHHAALLAYYQIHEYISEIVKGNKGVIREALSLVLQALKLSDSGPTVLASALERWASALAHALVDQRDLRQLLFLIHHLFRQTRSVRWAASVLNVAVNDTVGAARVLALMEVLFARTTLEAAVECVEANKEDEWEEVAKDGSAGAVSEGALRERDLLALLHALPLRDLVARIVLFTQSDIRSSREGSWAEVRGERDVVRACCGVRVLVRVVRRVLAARARYTRLRQRVRALALRALHTLAALHQHARSSYSKNVEYKVLGELQAAFVSGLEVVEPGEVPELPASLLADHAARDYCTGHMEAAQRHADDLSPRRVESLSIELPVLSCSMRVRTVSRAAVHRRTDYELARLVLDFLFQISIRRSASNVSCKGACRQTARESMPELLAAHPFLYPIALHLVAETNPVEKLEPSSIECLCLDKWRPQCGEIRAVLDDWSQRCPHLVEPLLLRLDYMPHTGVCLDSQLTIGSWLCALPAEPSDWRWRVLRRLRPHRACWGPGPPPPDPDPHPADLFTKAYALMASSWGHCIPLICSEGVEALCAIAESRASDALHCLAPVALVLASSPESVAATPRFGEVIGLIMAAAPSVMQRVLGRGGASGADLLLNLLRKQLREQHMGGVPRESLVSLWICVLWRTPASAALLDAALCSVPQSRQLQHYADTLARAQDEQSQERILQAMKWSSQAPLIAASALRAWHAQRELHTQLFPRLLDALHAQRLAGQRIHVDNALKMLRVSATSEELVVHRAAAAVVAAPAQHPARPVLWALLAALYLRRPPADIRDTTPPVGPLFFSGIIKSSTFTQLKRCLLENIKYHGDEAAILKNKITTNTQEATTSRSKSKSVSPDNNLTSPLTINDMTGESSDSSESEENEDREEVLDLERGDEPSNDNTDLLAYHTGAERLLCEYARWFDEGAKTRAQPHHADIARFIPERALDAAFRQEATRRRPAIPPDLEPFPLPPTLPPPPAPPQRTPFQDAKDALMKIKDRSGRRRSPRRKIKSPIEDVDFKDAHRVLAVVDKHLRDIEQLAQEWCAEAAAVSALDRALWGLVRSLRVPRQLPSLRAACANKCKPMVHTPQGQEWCISSGAEQAIKENRSSALAAVKKLARARPDAARRAAALLALARRASSAALAERLARRVWQCAARVSSRCAPAADLITSLFELLAERWLANNGKLCSELIDRWCGNSMSPLQQQLVGALVAPQRVQASHVPLLHAALLRAPLAPHSLFSFLSKFELARWSQSVDSTERRSLLEALSAAAHRWGSTPDEGHQLLLELVGVQTAAVCSATELCEVVSVSARACAAAAGPASHLTHLRVAATKCAPHLPYDQLGHLLRELGVIWWEARTGLRGSKTTPYKDYATHTAELLLILHAAFVAAAVQLSYAPEKVAAVAWASLLESWSPWVLPHSTPPLLSAVRDASYDHMVKRFTAAVRNVMADCPGSEASLLSCAFEWAVQSHGAVYSCQEQEARVQLSALLAELATLPWGQHQWMKDSTVQALLQISQCNDKEVVSWCALCCKWQGPAAWLSAAGDQISARLAALLYLFTSSPITFHQETLETACLMPWSRLPEVALDEALERFFAQNHGLATPYHELPQFRVILAASEMWSAEGVLGGSDASRQKRARVTSLWTRATAAPALAASAARGARALLAALTDIAHLVEASELEQLLERALVIICIEPAAAAVAPIWEKFVTCSDPRVLRASLQAIAGLTVFEYFATLADAAIRAYLVQDCGDWGSVVSVCARSVWTEPAPLCARARLHAAYAVCARSDVTARPDVTAASDVTEYVAQPRASYDALESALLALLAADINFVENEAIVSVWICVACRVALAGAGAAGASAGRGLVTRWAARRPLLSLGAGSARPTTKHRLLCLFAQCVLSPEDVAASRAFEAACVSAGEAQLGAWAQQPRPRRLPRLAAALAPHAAHYFTREAELMPRVDDDL